SPLSTSTTSEINEYYSIPFPIPPPPSIYNRSASSSVVSVGTSCMSFVGDNDRFELKIGMFAFASKCTEGASNICGKL
ncbi:unnamed protein product, partial [Rotaria socialis]